jgi:hypothetical protein
MRPPWEEDRDYRLEEGTASTLEVGRVVALALKADGSPVRVYVGEVQAVDENGVRLSLVDSWDMFVAWAQIAWALIATPKQGVGLDDEEAPAE